MFFYLEIKLPGMKLDIHFVCQGIKRMEYYLLRVLLTLKLIKYFRQDGQHQTTLHALTSQSGFQHDFT